MTDTAVEAQVAVPAEPAKPARKRAAKPKADKSSEPAVKPVESNPVELGYAETVANLEGRQSRLDKAYDAADTANNGPRADAVWRSLSRVDAQLNTLRLSSVYF